MTPTGRSSRRTPPATEPERSRHLRLVRAPRIEPDGGDRGGASTRDQAAAAPVQGALPLLFTLPDDLPARPRPSRRLQLVPTPLEDDESTLGEVATPRGELPDPRGWAAAFVQAAVETRVGDRPVSQLVRWTSRAVLDRLTHAAGTAHLGPRRGARRERRPVVRSVHLREPVDGVVEACAVVHDGTRARAAALRLEGIDGRWVCTAFDLL